jgi:hypothetical protein
MHRVPAINRADIDMLWFNFLKHAGHFGAYFLKFSVIGKCDPCAYTTADYRCKQRHWCVEFATHLIQFLAGVMLLVWTNSAAAGSVTICKLSRAASIRKRVSRVGDVRRASP